MGPPQRSRSGDDRRPLLSRTSTAYENEAISFKQDEKSPIPLLRAVALGISVFILIFILTCNVSLLTTIQSPIAEDLKASSEVIWFNSAYLIAITSVTPISGKLCQVFTPRVYLLASIIIQGAGLLLISQATTVSTFLLGRAACGIGSAAVTPVSFILVIELTPVKRRALFFGLINTGYTTGIACGAVIAGALEPVLGWRTVFWIQIPISITAAIVTFLAIPKREKIHSDNDTMTQKLARIDYFGVVTLVVSLVLLLYTLAAPRLDVRPLLLAIGMLVLFVFVEIKWAKEPIVPPSVMRSRANLLSGVATVGVMTARWGVLFYTPVYAIAVRGWKPSAAGALLIPTNAGFALGGIIAGWLHIRRTGSFYGAALTCFALFAAIHFGVSRLLTEQSPLWLFIIALFANGFAAGSLLNYSLAHLLHMTLKSDHVIVIPFNATFRSFSGSFGSAVMGGLFLRTLTRYLDAGFKSGKVPHEPDLIRRLIGAPSLVRTLTGDARAIAIDGYEAALKATFLAGVGVALLMFLVQAGVGWIAPEEKADPVVDADENDQLLSQESPRR